MARTKVEREHIHRQQYNSTVVTLAPGHSVRRLIVVPSMYYLLPAFAGQQKCRRCKQPQQPGQEARGGFIYMESRTDTQRTEESEAQRACMRDSCQSNGVMYYTTTSHVVRATACSCCCCFAGLRPERSFSGAGSIDFFQQP